MVDAIIAIEETIDQKSSKKIGAQGEALISKMKEVVKKGNISKILVTRDGDTIINIPLTVGVLGTVVAPWGNDCRRGCGLWLQVQNRIRQRRWFYYRHYRKSWRYL